MNEQGQWVVNIDGLRSIGEVLDPYYRSDALGLYFMHGVSILFPVFVTPQYRRSVNFYSFTSLFKRGKGRSVSRQFSNKEKRKFN